MREIKLLALADLHLMPERPPCRLETEDWIGVIRDKFKFLSTLCKEQSVDAVVIAGDIFDSWNKVPIELLNTAIELFQELKKSTIQKRILTIPGNHDSMYGNYDELHKAPYQTLTSVGLFTEIGGGTTIAAYLYNQKGMLQTTANIIVAHKGLYLKDKPFPTASDSGNVENFVNNCIPSTCELLIAGDYHTPFVTEVKQCTVVNCGSLLRLRADQIDYKPVAHIITRRADEEILVEKFTIPLQNPIRRDYIDDANEETKQLEEMIGGIAGDFEISSNYKTNFYNLTNELENKEQLNKLFEKTLTKKKGTSL